ARRKRNDQSDLSRRPSLRPRDADESQQRDYKNQLFHLQIFSPGSRWPQRPQLLHQRHPPPHPNGVCDGPQESILIGNGSQSLSSGCLRRPIPPPVLGDGRVAAYKGSLESWHRYWYNLLASCVAEEDTMSRHGGNFTGGVLVGAVCLAGSLNFSALAQ